MPTQSFLVAQVAGSIEWRLQESGPAAYSLTAFPGWSLLNPLSCPRGDSQLAGVQLHGRLGKDLIFDSHGLCFGHAGALDDKELGSDRFAVVSEVLRRLRYVARQFSIPRTVIALSIHNPGTNERLNLEDIGDFSQTFVRNYILSTALTEQHASMVAAMSSDFSIPVHAEVLLDALEAHIQQDYRKALLYGAIAIEVFARECLEAESKASLARSDPRHRVVALPVAGGTNTIKDPVFDLLAQSDNFARVLHELPLYVLGRSLLIDRPETYRRALRLYATRNKIAHQGIPPDDDKHFPFTSSGSAEALRAAIDTVAWFGDTGPYLVWDGDFVSAGDGRKMNLGADG